MLMLFLERHLSRWRTTDGVACRVRDVQHLPVSEQLSLYPIRATRIWSPSSSTVSRPRFATCEDGLDYCIKHDANGWPARANEWIGTWLARAVGIAVAKPAVIRDLNGELLFGSEIYGDDTNDNLGLFSSRSLSPEHIAHIWKTFVFDLFIANEDRHINQYKFFYQNKNSRVISFDFEQSLFKFWPDLPLPLPEKCNTIHCIRILQTEFGSIELHISDELLNRLEAIDGASMVAEVRRLPKGWLDQRSATSFTKWFGGRLRRDRIAQIREGLRDGTCL